MFGFGWRFLVLVGYWMCLFCSRVKISTQLMLQCQIWMKLSVWLSGKCSVLPSFWPGFNPQYVRWFAVRWVFLWEFWFLPKVKTTKGRDVSEIAITFIFRHCRIKFKTNYEWQTFHKQRMNDVFHNLHFSAIVTDTGTIISNDWLSIISVVHRVV